MTFEAKWYLGIDTGGTYTDGVLLDSASRKVLRTAKVLTTHSDLRQCIAEVLDCLAMDDDPAAIAMVSLSTTLATNAIAEGKRRPVALLLLGYDPELVHKFNFHRQFGTSHYFFIDGKPGIDGKDSIPLDEAEIAKVVGEIHGEVEAFAIASYAGHRNPIHEERAGEMVASLTGFPVVEAHHLSSELDSIRRATTASLNASLLSDTQEFLDAVQAMLEQRQIRCPVMIVRGDGSIVKAEFARKRPVEIIHSGPATSAIGGQFLAGVDSALVIDMGGTTTDIALVEQGKVQAEVQAATVGPYRTCVRTIRARSLGLGGDSLIRFDHSQNMTIGPERVLPFSHFCAEFPHMKPVLVQWLREKQVIHYHDRLECWALRKEPARPVRDARTRLAVQYLQEGPWLLPQLLKRVGVVSPYQLYVEDLINQGVIERVGLTPTDLLHVTGEYAPWDSEIARIIVDAIAGGLGIEREEFIRRARDWMTRQIAAEILQFLSGKVLSEEGVFKAGRHGLDRWLFEKSLVSTHPTLGCAITLKVPMVGIGAPAKAFLQDVARVLRTEIVFPEHYEVANAVGTVVGHIMVRLEGEVIPVVDGMTVRGFSARAAHVQKEFEDFEEARIFARAQLCHLVAAEALDAGAREPMVECAEEEILPDRMVRFSAWAVARPDLNGHNSRTSR